MTVTATLTPANSGFLHLISGSGVTESSGAGLRVGQLAVEARGAVNLFQSGNDVDLVAVRTTAGTIDFYDPDGYAVAVDGVNGMTTPSGAINLYSFNGDIAIADTPAAKDISGPANYQINVILMQGGTSLLVAPGAAVSGHGITVFADRVELGGTLETSPGRRVEFYPALRAVRLTWARRRTPQRLWNSPMPNSTASRPDRFGSELRTRGR